MALEPAAGQLQAAQEGRDKPLHAEEALSSLLGQKKSCCGLSLSQNQAIIGCVIGALVAIGGLFLLLAASGVLPHGVNAISQLGAGGYVLGALISAAGIATIITSLCLKRSPLEEALHSVTARLSKALGELPEQQQSGVPSAECYQQRQARLDTMQRLRGAPGFPSMMQFGAQMIDQHPEIMSQSLQLLQNNPQLMQQMLGGLIPQLQQQGAGAAPGLNLGALMQQAGHVPAQGT